MATLQAVSYAESIALPRYRSALGSDGENFKNVIVA